MDGGRFVSVVRQKIKNVDMRECWYRKSAGVNVSGCVVVCMHGIIACVLEKCKCVSVRRDVQGWGRCLHGYSKKYDGRLYVHVNGCECVGV